MQQPTSTEACIHIDLGQTGKTRRKVDNFTIRDTLDKSRPCENAELAACLILCAGIGQLLYGVWIQRNTIKRTQGDVLDVLDARLCLLIGLGQADYILDRDGKGEMSEHIHSHTHIDTACRLRIIHKYSM